MIFSWIQYLLPHHFLSSLMHRFMRIQIRWIKDLQIRLFIRAYGVAMDEAEPADYRDFNAFFTRSIRRETRPLRGTIASPVDGSVSQAGEIAEGRIFQAKGKDYAAHELLGEHDETFLRGSFATLYLSPRDYHRIHMPIDGRLIKTIHIPGRLFSVNPATTRSVPRLFARNERVVAFFETELGKMAMVFVGAIFVSSIETVWQGVITPPAGSVVRRWNYDLKFSQGQEIGRFNMGSTVILLFEKRIQWLIVPDAKIKMGQEAGTPC